MPPRQPSPETIDLERVDSKGRRSVVKMRAQVIERADDSDAMSDSNLAVSRVEEREYRRLLGASQDTVLIDPPYNLKKLACMRNVSTDLGQVIDAMVTNTVGFGWQLRERRMPDAFRAQHAQAIERERNTLKAALGTVHPKYSLRALLKMEEQDRYGCGNGYLEMIEDKGGRLAGLTHLRGHEVRLTYQDAAPTKVAVPFVRPDTFEIDYRKMMYRFRRFVQIRAGQLIWFKEAGDPRAMDYTTGQYAPTVPFERRATSLLQRTIYNAESSYGVPLWIGNIFDVLGNREAAEVNYFTLKGNNIPSMFVIIENGMLTPGSVTRLREFVERNIETSSNFSKFIVLEGEASEEGAPQPEHFRIKVEPLTQLQRDDALYLQYSSGNRDRVRESHRVSPLFTGRTDDITRATADASKAVTDEQVFAPERDDLAEELTCELLLRMGARFHTLRLNHPNVTNDETLVRLMLAAEKSGAMTPFRANRVIEDAFGDDIGPMPTGIDIHKPFTVTFAEAQQGMTQDTQPDQPGSPALPDEDTAEKMLHELLYDVERELDRREGREG